ncbi:MAG: hypothetical protein ACQZ3N_01590 [cyanobacterium endosymbiont of Rhopalodia yunnanensis]
MVSNSHSCSECSILLVSIHPMNTAYSIAYYELVIFELDDIVFNLIWRQGMIILPFMTP